jgi:hypothetical protein
MAVHANQTSAFQNTRARSAIHAHAPTNTTMPHSPALGLVAGPSALVNMLPRLTLTHPLSPPSHRPEIESHKESAPRPPPCPNSTSHFEQQP